MATSSALALAAAQAEGFNNGARGAAVNNPGDIFSGGELSEYPTLQDGWDALENQINKWTSGQSAYVGPDTTMAELGQIYTGGDNAEAWTNAVTSHLQGITPDSTVAQAAVAQPTASLLSKMGQWWKGATGTPTVVSAATSPITRAIVALVGIVFLAGGIFGFHSVHETVVQSVKAGAKVAAE